MKFHTLNFQKSSGMTLVEVLIAAAIIVIGTVSFLMFQKTSWLQTSKTNRYLLAGQVIQKHIEAQRMLIASDPVTNYPDFKTHTSSSPLTETDNSTKPPITIKFTVYDTLHAPDGTTMNACQVDVRAFWGTSDTLKVTTCFARNF